jgi:hypothetical protein
VLLATTADRTVDRWEARRVVSGPRVCIPDPREPTDGARHALDRPRCREANDVEIRKVLEQDVLTDQVLGVHAS